MSPSFFKGIVEARLKAFEFVHYPWKAYDLSLGHSSKAQPNKANETEPRGQKSKVTIRETSMLVCGIGACNTDLD